MPTVGITQLKFTLITAADPAGRHLVGKVLVAGRGVVSGVIGARKGQGNEPLAPHLIAYTQPLLLPDALSGDAIAAGDPVVIADPGGEIRGRVVGMKREGEGAAKQP